MFAMNEQDRNIYFFLDPMAWQLQRDIRRIFQCFDLERMEQFKKFKTNFFLCFYAFYSTVDRFQCCTENRSKHYSLLEPGIFIH